MKSPSRPLARSAPPFRRSLAPIAVEPTFVQAGSKLRGKFAGGEMSLAKLFFSYSHADKGMLDQLEVQLSMLKRQDIIET